VTTSYAQIDRWRTPIAGGLLGVIMVLLLHRYVGINHDSILYLGQALAQRWPQIFGQDLFFVHGSQDRYSIAPWLLSEAVGIINPPMLFLWGSAVGLLGFFLAGWYCLRVLLPADQRYWAWLATICLPPVYGMTQLFSYGEKFLTPRPFSEALCLVSIAFFTHKRTWLALLCLGLACILHPLQMLAASLIIWPWLVIRDRRWLHACWLGIPILFLAYIGVKPFPDLYVRIDPTWLYNLYDATPQLFLSKWGLADFNNLLFDVFLLIIAQRILPLDFARWCRAAIFGLMLGFAVTALLVDSLHLALPAALQLWRVHWLAHWLSIAAIGGLCFYDIHAKNFSRALLLALAATFAWGEGTWEWCAFAMLYAVWPRIHHRLPSNVTKLIGILLGSLVLLLSIEHTALQLTGFKNAGYQLDLFPFDRLLLAFPAIGFGLPLLCVFLWNRLTEGWQKILFLSCLIPLTILSCWCWDSRGLANRVFENNVFKPSIFGIMIPEHAQVFWYPGSIMGPWLVLQRANYFSPGQVAGEIFSRETAIDARGRIEKLRPLIEQGLGCDQARLAGTYHRDCAISPGNLRIACEPGPVPPPDFLVLPYQQPQGAIGTWALVDPAGLQSDSKLYLYKCSDLVASLTSK
jgi:hypothetical protein